MATLEFRDGKYYLKGAGTGSQRRMLMMLPPLVVTVIVLGIFLSNPGSLPGKPGGDGLSSDWSPLAVFLPFMAITVVSLVLALVMAGRQSVAMIDPSAGTVSFTRGQAGRNARRVSIPFSAIRDLVLSARNGGWDGRPGVKNFVVRLMTTDGEEDLLMLTDEAEARRLAQEIAGIISRSLRDLT